jgi:FMN reductase
MEKKQTSPRLAGLGGSMREKSYSRAALREVLRIAEANGAATELLDVRELNLPMFVPDLPIDGYPSSQQANITRFVEACRRADVMIWASPTYHGALTGAVKNALDFMEFLSDDEPPYLQGRAVGLMTIPDPTTFAGMINAVHELRAWLAPTQVTLSRQHFTAELALNDERTQRRLTRLVNELLGFANANTKLKK